MKILYFHQHFSTPKGSTGTRSYEMCRALIARGHNVHVICGSAGMSVTGIENTFEKGRRTALVDGIVVTELELPYSNKQGFLKRTLVFLRYAFSSILITLKEPSDLVFATSTPLTAGIPGIFSKLFLRKKFVFEVRDLWPELPREMGVITNPIVLFCMSFLEYLSYRCSDACIGLSPGIVDGIKRRSRDDLEVELIPNGCDLELFSPVEVQPVRPEGIADNDFMCIFTGAHGEANGLEAVLDTANVLVHRKRFDIKIVFIGDGKYKDSLVQRAKMEKLTNCIFLDPIAKTELASFLKGSDVGLMILKNVPAFYYGTSPNKFFDYISVGLPVVTNYPGWLAEMISKNNLGAAVKPNDPNSFADQLEVMANERHDLLAMAKNSYQFAKDNFDRSDLANRFVEFLERHGDVEKTV